MRSHFLLGWLQSRASDIDWHGIRRDLQEAGQAGTAALLAMIPEELGSAEQNHRQELYSRLEPFIRRRLEVLPDLIDNLQALVEKTA